MEMIHARKRLSEPEAQCYMWQLVNTIAHLHENSVIHRDLKLGNVFLDANLDLKVGDFGLATQLVHPEERKRTLCGTPNYIAPEILENNNAGHSFEVDIWSLGVIMYTLLIGRPPFETTSVRSTYKRIRANSYAFPHDIPISSAAKRLISTILNSTPELRPTLADIMSHDFFTQSPFPKRLPISARSSLPRNLMNGQLVTVPIASSSRAPFSDRTNVASNIHSSSGLSKPTGILAPLSKSKTSRPHTSKTRASTRTRAASVATKTHMEPPTLSRAQTERSDRQPMNKESDFVYSDKKNIHVTSPGHTAAMDDEDRAEFKRVHHDIEQSFSLRRGVKSAEPASGGVAVLETVSVNKWVDYTNKYGVGYLLTNGNVGVYFNDSSMIIESRDGVHFEYIPRKGEPGGGNRHAYTVSDYPAEHKKKVTLLNHFRKYLKNKAKTSGPADQGPVSSSNMVYVKKWLRTNHAILFRLSNQAVQVIFFDQTEILLSSSTRQVVYTDKKQQVTQYPLDSVVDTPRPDLARRMRYTQDILFHLLSSSSKPRRGSV